MISLGGLEDEITAIAKQKGWGGPKKDEPIVALTSMGQESDKPLLVLFTTFELPREELNTALRETGHGRLIKIAEIRRIEEIPLTATGKIQYRVLEEKNA